MGHLCRRSCGRLCRRDHWLCRSCPSKPWRWYLQEEVNTKHANPIDNDEQSLTSDSQILRHSTSLPHDRPRPNLRPSLPLPRPHRKGLREILLPPGAENIRNHIYLLGPDISDSSSLRRRAGSNRQNTTQSRHRRSRPNSWPGIPSSLPLRLHGSGNPPMVSSSQGLIPNELPLRCFARVSRVPVLHLGFVSGFHSSPYRLTNTICSYRRRHRDNPDQVHLPCRRAWGRFQV